MALKTAKTSSLVKCWQVQQTCPKLTCQCVTCRVQQGAALLFRLHVQARDTDCRSSALARLILHCVRSRLCHARWWAAKSGHSVIEVLTRVGRDKPGQEVNRRTGSRKRPNQEPGDQAESTVREQAGSRRWQIKSGVGAQARGNSKAGWGQVESCCLDTSCSGSGV